VIVAPDNQPIEPKASDRYHASLKPRCVFQYCLKPFMVGNVTSRM